MIKILETEEILKGYKFKNCKCNEDFWEEIVVKNDFHYNNQTVIYYHCSCCGEDFRVENFYTKEEATPSF